MSVDRYHYDLEALFGFSEITSESSTHDSEQLILHKDFQRQTQRFSLYGVSIDKIEVEQLLGFVIKVIYARYVGTLNGSFSNMANCLFPMLQILLRRRICPHTDGFGALGSWDAIFFDVIENIVLPSILMPAWKRMYKGLVLNDLQSSNFEGTGSAVMQMHRSIAKLAETVPYGNICDLQEVLRDCCIMDNWFTPRCVRIGLLDRWSLLHLAASSATASKEVLLYLVQQVGCETSFTDIKGRTALHIAALALNYEGVLYLSTVSPAAAKVTDTSGKTPLALLLHSVSLCSWQKKPQSHRMQQMITALIPAANPEFIWHCEYQENLQSDNNHPQLFSAGINDTFATSTIPIVMFSSQAQCQHLAFLKSCLFYRAVTLTDDGVADEVVRIAKSCASSVRWHIEVAKEAICTCIRDPRVRVSTVKLLLQEFFPVGVDEGDACVGRENQQQQHLQSLDLCLCHAVVSAKHAKTEKVVLKTLLDLFSNHLVPSKVNNVLQSATSAGPFAFIYLSVLSGDPVLLTVVLAALPHKVVQDLVYSQHAHCVQPELIDVECQFDYDNCRRHLEFFIPSDSTSVFWALMKHPHISPMSLACAMGSAEMVNTLLRACYVAPGSQRSGERQEKEHYFPARYCVAVGAAGCLRIIKNVHSVESFYELCYTAKGDGEDSTLFSYLLEEMGRKVVSSNRDHQDSRVQRMNSEGDFRGYAECLKLMLDCLPAHTAATCTTAPVTLLLQRVSPSSIDDTLTGGSSGIHANLHRRLRLVEVAVDEILSRHAAHLEHVLADTGCLDSLLEKDSEVYIQAKSQWDFNSAAQQKVAAELRSPYLQTSIRLISKRFTPDKKWIKLAYCLTRLLGALGVSTGSTQHSRTATPVDGESPSSSGGTPSYIDLSSWQELSGMLGRLAKANDLFRGFFDGLVRAQEAVFSPLHSLQSGIITAQSDSFYDSIAEECASIHSVLHDNQLLVLLKCKRNFPFGNIVEEAERTPAVPHYQVNDFKPDHRVASAYTTLYDWLEVTLRSVAMRKEFKTTVLPVNCPSTGPHNSPTADSISALAYVQLQMLLTEQKKLRGFLEHSSAPPHRAVCVLDLLNFHGQAVALTDSIKPQIAELRRELERVGLCAAEDHNSFKRELQKQNNHKMAEKILCVLVESNDRLGGDVTALRNHLLPLCALNMWSAAHAVLQEVQRHPRPAKSTFFGMFTVAPRWQRKLGLGCAAGALSHYSSVIFKTSQGVTGERHVLCADCLVSVTPMHLAILGQQDAFLGAFIETFPDFPVDLVELSHFALEHDCTKMLSSLMLASSALRGNLRNCNASADIIPFNDHQQARSVDATFCTTRSKLVHELIGDAVSTAMRSSHDDQSSDARCFPPFVLDGEYEADASGMPLGDSQVLLMDGSRAPWREVVADAHLLALALPAPLCAGGLFGSGHTFLHQACMLSEPELALWMLENSASWRGKCFQVDSAGATPLSLALAAGHSALAIKMLDWVQEESNGSSVHLPDLFLQQSHTGTSSAVPVRVALLEAAKAELRALEQAYFVPDQVCSVRQQATRVQQQQTSWIRAMLPPKYGIRGYRVTSSVDALALYLHGAEELWLRITSSDPDLLQKVCAFSGCGQLDSVIRARQVITLLGIPLSQLAVQNKDLRGGNAVDAARENRAKRDFTGLCPKRLRKLVSLPTALQLKSIVCGWYRQRSTATASSVDDSTFLHRTCDVSIVELGQGGSELSCFLRRHASYMRACDRVRAVGVPVNEKAQVFATLCEQMKMEFRFDNSSTSRENMLRRGNSSRLDHPPAPSGTNGAKVLSLLQTMQIDAAACANILSLSYLILDFARALCISRQLVAATTLPAAPMPPTSRDTTVKLSQSVDLATHPLDALYEKLAVAKRRMLLLELILSSDPAVLANREEGVMSRIRICDFLTAASLRRFFQLDAKLSDRFASLRAFVVEGLSNVLQDQGEFQLSEFVCRYLTIAAAAASEEETVLETSANGSISSGSSKYCRITDSEAGIERVLSFIQHLRVADLVKADSSAFENNRTLRFSYSNASKMRDLSVNSHLHFACDAAEEITTGGNLSPDLYDEPHVLRDITPQSLAPSLAAYSAKRNIARQAEQSADRAVADLNGGYKVAQALFRLVSAAAHLPTETDLYECDVHHFVSSAHLSHPMLALCKPSQSYGDLQNTFPRVRHLHALRNQREVEVDCCKRLLALGADPVSEQEASHSPLVCAVVHGRADLLALFLECSSQETLRAVPGYNFLVWHVLCECAGPADVYDQESRGEHTECLRLLLRHQFPAEAPEGGPVSSLELAALLGLGEGDLLAVCGAKSGSPTTNSLLRTLRLLMMRGGNCPVTVVELLIKRLNPEGRIRLLAEEFSLSEFIRGGDFQGKVLDTHAEFLAPLLFQDNKHHTHSEANARHRFVANICSATLSLQRSRKCCNNRSNDGYRSSSSSSLVDRDIVSCAEDLQSQLTSFTDPAHSVPLTSSSPSVFLCVSLLDLLTSASNDRLCAVVIASLSAELTSALRVPVECEPLPELYLGHHGSAAETNAASSVVRVLCSACAHDSVGFLTAFERIYTTWQTSQATTEYCAVESKGESSEVDDSAACLSGDSSRVPSWVDVLNRTTQCPDLRGPACTPIDAAVKCNSVKCIKYICTLQGACITFCSLVTALVRGQIPESTGMLLMTHLLPTRLQVDHVLLEYDSMEHFLNTLLHHHDPQGGDVVSGESLLHLCCRRGYALFAKYLLDLGADPLLPDAMQCTPLQGCISAGHAAVTKVIYAFCPERVQNAVAVLVYGARKFLLRRVKRKYCK